MLLPNHSLGHLVEKQRKGANPKPPKMEWENMKIRHISSQMTGLESSLKKSNDFMANDEW